MSESQQDRLARKIEASKKRHAATKAASVGNGVFQDANGRFYTRRALPYLTGGYLGKSCGCKAGDLCAKCRPPP